MSNQIKDISFTCHSVKGTHKIQLLKYSCNVQRALAVKLSLKSKRESEKKRELGNRHLMLLCFKHNMWTNIFSQQQFLSHFRV